MGVWRVLHALATSGVGVGVRWRWCWKGIECCLRK